VWLAPTWEGMVAIDGLLEAEAGHTLLAALEPLARPADANDPRSGGQRTADALTELARRALEGGRLPKVGGVRPQLTVTVDLDSLLGHPGGVGGEAGWAGAAGAGGVPAAGLRRGGDPGPGRPRVAPGSWSPAGPAATATPITAPATRNTERPATYGESATHGERRGWRRGCGLRPPSCRRCWVGRPASPSTSGGAAGSSSPTAQRSALTVRDRGCVFPDCARPLSWCDAHHLCHWLDGGPTDLANLALVCRAHHRAVHEGGWRLIRGPDGRFTATPSQRTQRPHPRHPSAA